MGAVDTEEFLNEVDWALDIRAESGDGDSPVPVVFLCGDAETLEGILDGAGFDFKTEFIIEIPWGRTDVRVSGRAAPEM